MATATGVSVPFRFTQAGYPTACVGTQCLHDSVYTILSTIPGERVMRPTFGSYLRVIVFDNISRATGYRAQAEVRRAIASWEPRVSVVDVLFEIADTTLTVHVTWQSNGTQLAVTSLTLPKNGG